MDLQAILLAEISQNIKGLQLQLDYERAKIVTALGGEPALYGENNELHVGIGASIAGAALQVDGNVTIGDGAGGKVSELGVYLYQTGQILRVVKSGTYSGMVEVLIPDCTIAASTTTSFETGLIASQFGGSQRAMWYAEVIVEGEQTNNQRTIWGLSRVKYDAASPEVTGTSIVVQSSPATSYLTGVVLSIDSGSNLVISITNAEAVNVTGASIYAKLICSRW